MNQKDPNNISGLLKMHLRENNLLTNASAAVIIRNITRDMASDVIIEGVGLMRYANNSIAT